MISSILVACVLAANPVAVASPDLVAYKEAKAQAGRDADAHIRLALWCEARGMNAERTKHLTIATLIDPANATARGLLGMVHYKGKWLSPDAVAEQMRNDPQQQAIVREYLERRVKTPDKADNQNKLALWCEENGLRDQAKAHFHRTVQLDPSREQAWKHLGYKKEKGRWAKPEQAAAQKELIELQIKAHKQWKLRLDKLRLGLASRNGEESERSQAALDEIKDPMAVPAIWQFFGQGNPSQQAIAIRLFGQIDSRTSSRALAYLAVASQSADIRRTSVEILRSRDPRDFAEILISFLEKPIEFEIRNQAGLDSPGELFVKGKVQNLQRLYTHLPPPSIIVQSGDSLSVGPDGLPILVRYLGNTTRGHTTRFELAGVDRRALEAEVIAERTAQVAALENQRLASSRPILGSNALPPAMSDTLQRLLGGKSSIAPYTITRGVDNGDRYLFVTDETNSTSFMDIPIGQMMLDTERSVQLSRQQLMDDVQQLKAYNNSLRETNRTARQVLVDSTGTDLGDDPEEWKPWLTNLMGYASPQTPYMPEVPTVTEEVPSNYLPQAVVNYRENFNGYSTRIVAANHSCFAAGTPVLTVDGDRRIEMLRPGDRVLTQNTETGRIRFSPILNVFHNPPDNTLKIYFTGDVKPIVATGIHRFWKTGHGWVMARDLKSGDVLRTVGGSATVHSIEPDRKQPVFNLRVADGADFFVGEAGVLAHDNSLVTPAEKPFDRVTSTLTTADRN